MDIYADIGKCIAQHVPYALERMWNSLDGSEDVVINTDRQALIAIFTNLLDNALKYAPPGSRIEANVRSLAPLGCYITLRDNGPGVSEEHLPRLFERFYRVPGTQQTGSGLGLAIARTRRQNRRAAARHRRPRRSRHRFYYRFAGKLPATDGE